MIDCVVATDVCDASYAYEYDHLTGVTETIIKPTFTVSPGCSGTPAYTCTDNSVGMNSNLCTANSDDYSRFNMTSGELKMLSNYELNHRAGTYYIEFGVSVDGQTASCSTQVNLTDPCESATFTLLPKPSPVFEDKTLVLGDPETDIMSWTWAQITS